LESSHWEYTTAKKRSLKKLERKYYNKMGTQGTSLNNLTAVGVPCVPKHLSACGSFVWRGVMNDNGKQEENRIVRSIVTEGDFLRMLGESLDFNAKLQSKVIRRAKEMLWNKLSSEAYRDIPSEGLRDIPPEILREILPKVRREVLSEMRRKVNRKCRQDFDKELLTCVQGLLALTGKSKTVRNRYGKFVVVLDGVLKRIIDVEPVPKKLRKTRQP